MGKCSGTGNATSRMQKALVFMLKVWMITMSIGYCALHVQAIRASRLLSTEAKDVLSLKFPNDLIGEDPDRLHEQGKTANETALGSLPHANSTLSADGVQSLRCDYRSDLQYTQTKSSYLPNGLPVFHVTFTNTCLDCTFSNIHVGCGKFTSAKQVNPAIFKRIGNNDCLLNNRKPLAPQDIIAMEYISSFSYPMKVVRADTSCGEFP